MPRILAVDDEIICLEIIGLSLKRLGYDIIPVESGDKALEILSSDAEGFDLILLDMVMPNMNGAEFLEKARQIDHAKYIPVILQTGIYDCTSFIKFKDDFLFFLPKPYKKEDLINFIEKVLTKCKKEELVLA